MGMSSYKILLVIIFSMLLGNGVAVARDGNDLLKACETVIKYDETNKMEGSWVDVGYCLGLIKGVSVTMVNYNYSSQDPFLTACFPELGLNGIQAARIVTSYLKNNPADLHEEDTYLALIAFLEAYPCE
jgi:hypothetical protein